MNYINKNYLFVIYLLFCVKNILIPIDGVVFRILIEVKLLLPSVKKFNFIKLMSHYFV